MSTTSFRTPDGELPNILLIIADQQRSPQHFSREWQQRNLPVMQLLKENGVNFPNGFCNTCMCSPSRSTLFTSLHPSQHGVTDTLTYGGKYAVTQTELDSGIPNMATLLRPMYDVQYRGKFHLSKGGLNQVHAAEKALMSSEVAVYGWQGWVAPDAGEDTKIENFGGGYANHDARYVQEAIDYIREYHRRKEQGLEKRPFFLTLSLVNPHDVLSYPSFFRLGGYDDEWIQGDLELPPTFGEDIQKYKPAAQAYARLGMATQFGPVKRPERMREYVNFYGNLQALIDRELSRLLELFYTNNDADQPTQLAHDTLIIRTADHGEMGMAHGGLRQKSYNIYEETIRIPLIFSNPWFRQQFGAFASSDQMFSLIDVLPTLGGMLGLTELFYRQAARGTGQPIVDQPGSEPPPNPFKGRDLSSIVMNPTEAEEIPNPLLFTYDDVGAPIPTSPEPIPAANRIRCVRTKYWKYARYFHASSSYPDEYELYFIKGVHLVEDVSVGGGRHPEGKPVAAVDDIDPDFEGWLLKLPYETANYANQAYLQELISEGAPQEYMEKLADIREAMAALLREKEKNLYINQQGTSQPQGATTVKKVAELAGEVVSG